MADWFFTQDGTESGTIPSEPAGIGSWATWFTTFINPADTVYIIGTVTPSASLEVTDNNVTIRGDYAGYEAGVIDGQDTIDYCLKFVGKSTVEVRGITLKNAVLDNLLVNSNGASVTSCIIDSVTTSGAGRYYVGAADTTTGTGILLINNNLNNSITGIAVTNCVSNNNGKHGFDFRGSVDGYVRNCSAKGNGFTNTGHGFHTNAALIEANPANWSVFSGNVYQCDQNLFGYIPEDVNINVTDADRRWLTYNGDNQTPGLNEWSYYTTNNTLYINVGADVTAATANIRVCMVSTGTLIIEDCVAEENIDVDGIEGMGFSFDNCFPRGILRRCISRNNPGDGMSLFNARDCRVESSLFYGNGRNGINYISLARDCALYHITSADNGMSGYWFPRSVNPTVYNCISLNNGVDTADTSGFRLNSLLTTGLTEGGNLSYNSGTGGTNNYTNMTGTTADPLLYPDYQPKPTSPCKRAGVSIDALTRLDYSGRAFKKGNPTIGAFEQLFATRTFAS